MRTATAARRHRRPRPAHPARPRKAAPSAAIPSPPAYQQHEVTLSIDHHVFELAVWAFAYEQRTDANLHPSGRTFEQFLVDCIDGGLEFPLRRWEATQGVADA